MSIATAPTNCKPGRKHSTSREADRLARLYDGLGWRLCPVRPGTKKAAIRWKRLQASSLRPRPARWSGAWAVILGKASGGLCCRDFDSKKSYRRWARAHPKLARTLPTVETRRGFHTYFRGGPEGYAGLPDGEYRADAKHYCLLPPSLHPSGRRYRWLIPPTDPIPIVTDPESGLLPAVPNLSHQSLSTVTTSPKDSSPIPIPISCVPLLTFPPRNGDENRVLQGLIERTLPTRYGERHHRIFDFARRLKALPCYRDLRPDALRELFAVWWQASLPRVRTKQWSESWNDFTDAWQRIRWPAHGATLTGLQQWVFATVPAGGFQSEDGDLLRLSLVCEYLQSQHGTEPFFLAVRTAADLLGISKTTAARRLDRLVRAGELALVTRGTRATGLASEFRFSGTVPVFSLPEEREAAAP